MWMGGNNLCREKLYKNAYIGNPTTSIWASEADKRRFSKLLYGKNKQTEAKTIRNKLSREYLSLDLRNGAGNLCQ